MLFAISLLSLGTLALARPSAPRSLSCTAATFEAFLASSNITATVNSAQAIAANGTFEVTNNTAYPSSPTKLQALCAVEVNVTSEAGTHYSFGLFLPDAWNNRFLAVGNGGYAGGINYIDMGAGAGYGFAVMSTDTGHSGGFQETAWAYNNTESITDWGWRAMHGSTVASKALINAWYGSASEYNYFSGCSVGGRQGLRALQLFPEDFDGVSAGAPAWWTTHNQLWAVKTLTYNYPANASHFIPSSMFNVIGAEVIKQCDPQDGVTDTIISDPFRCNFNPLTLLCAPNVTESCLIPDQIETLNKIYNDWVETNQTYVFSHLLLGTEASWNNDVGTGSLATLESQSGFAQDLMQLGDSWTFEDLTIETVELADEINPGNATADDFDLSPFYNRGGKLIHHHGLSDGTLATGSSLYFYTHVVRAIWEHGIDVDDFYRLFLIPGMEHCQSTPSNMNAPWYIAGANQPASISTSLHSVPCFSDAKHDVILALMAWVENGTAPDSIIATKWVDDNTQAEVSRQRPICPYPKEAKYNGTGDVDSADSWECATLY
ncbi:uncharacterized protein EHS24_008890 [Apiotrichum porosum]|uniref:Carboxylic ester hydrolase n=1 Tax=Apiotrichum porosum TaxID=105984 RepID=A0A427XNH5_9TREE|nr:uncharacterized protein EHS24_008890 [Apiotrichum porosum]RSH80314.1 hypothetical protein EHS24_008890 [Apiotrichum porosum]